MTRDRILVDRRAFLLSGLAAPALLLNAGQAEQSCALDVELTQGPYYLDRGLLRKNITESKPGLPLQLQLTVLDFKTCKPVSNAGVEIWHCDASGIYSGYVKASMNGPGGGPGGFGGRPPGPPPDFDPSMGPPGGGFCGPGFGPGPGGPPPGGMHATDDGTFLRGLQLTNAQGVVEFETVYPGWYVGRDTHIHLKVHTRGALKDDKYAGGHVVHTGQLFFADELSDEIAQLEPYAKRRQITRVRLDEDMVFNDAHGAGVMLKLDRVRANSLEFGLTATAFLHIDSSAIHDREGRPRFGGPPA